MYNGMALAYGCGEGISCKDNQAPYEETKSVYIAAALVEKGYLAANDIGSSDVAEGGLAIADSVIAEVRKLNRAGHAIYIPSPYLSGSKPLGEDVTPSNAVFGLRLDPTPNGTKRVVVTLNYKNFYTAGNVRFFNELAKNKESYDVVLWTENTVSILDEYDIDILAAGYAVAGNAGENITGTFGLRYIGEEPVPYPHNSKNDLEKYTKLTLVDGTPTGTAITLAACSGKCKRFNATYATGGFTGTIPFTVSETDAPCVKWALHPCGGATLPTGISITNNGVVTFTDYATAPTTKYTVVAYTDSCIVGEFCFEISAVVAP